jgi:N-methylhydantoinase B/oxoprolinase/acetone carboxylase alpha subunit
MTELDPIALAVTTGALRAACEEMGATLVRAAHSANIKERRDCSTALFDAAGEMVMQAEHIPAPRCSASRPAAPTMPTSAAVFPARCRPIRTRSTRRES